MRIVILGAGVMGLSTAYHLARQNAGQIVLIDKGPVGNGSSSRAAAIITGHLWTQTGVEVRKRSLALYRELSQTLSGYTFHQSGCLNLFDPASWSVRKQMLSLYDRLSVPYEVMNASEMKRHWPAIHLPEDWIGLFDPVGGYSEPEEYLLALRARVQELGVEIRECELVTKVDIKNGRIAGIQVGALFLEVDVVVSTVFSWTRALLKPIGIQLPMKSFVHQRYVSHPVSSPIHVPAVNANPASVYFRPSSDNTIMAGLETSEREEYVVDNLDFHMSHLEVSAELRHRLTNNLASLLPTLSAGEWASEKVGLITFSMDGEPIVGPAADISGLFVAAAFHSGGFAYSPAIGELLAEYVIYDKPQSAAIDSWLPRRFARDEVSPYLERKLRQRDAFQRRH